MMLDRGQTSTRSVTVCTEATERQGMKAVSANKNDVITMLAAGGGLYSRHVTLSDGATCIVSYRLSDLQQIGDVRFPSPLVIELDMPRADRPHLVITSELVNGSVAATELTMTARPGQPISPSAMAEATNIDRWLDELWQLLGLPNTVKIPNDSAAISATMNGETLTNDRSVTTPRDGHDGHDDTAPTPEQRTRIAPRVPTGRRGGPALPDDHYRLVADVWRQQGMKAVQARWNRSYETAARWVRKARELGFITEA